MTIYSPLPAADLTPRDFDDCKLEETDGALTISLWDGDSRTASLSFSFVYCYRKLDEGDALETLHEISTTSELGHLLYVGDDSAFMSWFHRESAHIHVDKKLMHICVCTLNSQIDVITDEIPEIEINQ